jgi:hypothetical protein
MRGAWEDSNLQPSGYEARSTVDRRRAGDDRRDHSGVAMRRAISIKRAIAAGAAAQADDEADRANQRPPHRPKKAETLDNNEKDIKGFPSGTSRAYALRRLRTNAELASIDSRRCAGHEGGKVRKFSGPSGRSMPVGIGGAS